jgi:hypothetical protein
MDTTGEKEKMTSKKDVDGRSRSSHDNKKFRTRSMEEQRGPLSLVSLVRLIEELLE